MRWLAASYFLVAIALQVRGQTPEAKPVEQGAPVSLRGLSVSLEDLTDRVGRSVVQIFSSGFAPADSDDDSGDTSVLTKQRSTGSGIVLSSDGYILTNAHVVQSARRVQVRLPSKRERIGPNRSILPAVGPTIDAKVIGIDHETDLAVIKIERNQLPYLVLGNSDELRQGQLVLAFGNPLGLEGSVSMGIISSTSRQIEADSPMVYIQTDAPINPGNSGGPLVDGLGKVVGINTFILSQSGGSEGIGFAVPSNIALNVYHQIRRDGHVHRGQIGVRVQSVSPALANGLKLPQDWGVLVADVEPDGPADNAGVKIGDIILTLDGKLMEDARQFEVSIYQEVLKRKVQLGVLRKNDKLTLDVPVIERADDPQRFADLVDPEKNLVPRLGILGIAIDKSLLDLLPDLRNGYGIVVAARSDPTLATDLDTGDVIYSVNKLPVTSVAALNKALRHMRHGAAAVLQIERDGQLMFVPVELE